jgi:FkbM family methyltransferase
MLRSDIRGAWRTMSFLETHGLLNKTCVVPFLVGSSLRVPLDWHWFWTHQSLTEYEPTTLKRFAETVNLTATGNATVVDGGAHIGLVSHYLAYHCPSVVRTWAFEPNPHLVPVLRANCESMPHEASAVAKALSDFTGRATLIVPDGSDADGAYIVAADDGAIEVTRVDDLLLPADLGLILKIDVEGSELAILKGAQTTLRAAPFFVVLFEAHPEVMKRTGCDPIECVRFLNALRPCRWMLSSSDTELDLTLPFFPQLRTVEKRDVIVHTIPRTAAG